MPVLWVYGIRGSDCEDNTGMRCFVVNPSRGMTPTIFATMNAIVHLLVQQWISQGGPITTGTLPSTSV